MNTIKIKLYVWGSSTHPISAPIGTLTFHLPAKQRMLEFDWQKALQDRIVGILHARDKLDLLVASSLPCTAPSAMRMDGFCMDGT